LEQKTINKNKLITILCAVALTLGVLVSAVLFSVTPVHAGLVDSIPEGYNSIEMSAYNKITLNNGESQEKYPDFPQEVSESITMYIPEDVYIGCYQKDDYLDYNISNRPVTFILLSRKPFTTFYYIDSGSNAGKIWSSVASYNTEHGYYFNSTIFKNAFGSVGQSDFSYSHVAESKFSHSVYTYSTDEELYQYFCDVADKKIDASIPNIQDTSDETYSFTGFTMSGKAARWTGTTERSCAKDVDVEEYVKISYAWATTTEPDNLGELQSYDGEFSTSDKQLTLPWSEMENGKTDFQFIRQVKISPCYRVPNLAYYIGQPVTIYYNADGSIDKISNPNTPGVLDESIPIPVLSVNNDNGTFLFTNAQNDYKFELKGRFWSTDDFYVFRKTPSLVWQYKYLTLLKNSLTTWVSVGDNMSTLSTYSFGDLGAESWNDLISTYPIENRNIITGEQQGWFSWANITGYNDAVTTLKTLLSTPYSLFNGYEVYVRYYVVCGDGSIRYSKWTHYFNNLADADGSTGSIVDDASNMNNGNQSDKGLTDSDIDNVENSGNSRNDVDAKPSSDFSVDISNVTELFSQFINILKSFYSGMGQLPSLINAIFGFLPSWVSAMIGVSLFVIVILRIIGR
jgi:hypothetical protein